MNNKIAVIDDDKGICRLLLRMLNKEGFITREANTGKEGIELLADFNPELILLDYKLPDMTANEFLQKIDVTGFEFIIMTGFGNERIAVEMMKQGAKDYVVKDDKFLELLPNIINRVYTEINLKQRLKESEVARKESEEKLSSIFNNTTIGIYRTTIDGKITTINKAGLKILGFRDFSEVDDINLNSSFSQKIYDRRTFIDMFQNKNELTGYEFVWKDSNGKDVYIRENSKAFRNTMNEIEYFEGTLEDITERVKAEIALRESEERLKLVMDAANDGIWDWNVKTNRAYCSPRFFYMLGFDSNIIEKGFLKILRFVHPVDLRELIHKVRCHMIGNTSTFECEFRLKNNNGDYFWVLGRGKIVEKNTHGMPLRMVGITTDISERKKAQQKLEEYKEQLEELVEIRTKKLEEVNKQLLEKIEIQKYAEAEIQDRVEFLRTLIETAANPIFIKDTNKRYIECNNAFEKYFEIKRFEIIGKKDTEFLNLSTAQKYESIDESLLTNPGTVEYEAVYITEYGRKREFILNKSTFLKSDGSIGGIIAIITDISERKKLEENILKALEKERELKDLKTRFVSITSHEFRTPLTTILSSVDLLDAFRQKENYEKYYGHINKIKEASLQMTELIDDILTVNKTENLKLEFIPKEINLYELCSTIIEELRTHSEIHSIFFDYKFADKIVFLDSKLMHQIIRNLLSNAIKYSPLGGEIKLIVEGDNNLVKLEIQDSGIGIPEKDKANLFEPFYRCKNTGNIPGTGLGLSIVKKSVEIQNGIITFESEENIGTKFLLEFPLINKNGNEKNTGS